MNVFLIGNSFSQNATRYLPELAAEGGFTLQLGRAEVGGCSLQRHWEHFQAAERGEAEGRFYDGQTLRGLISAGEWDVVTLQQASVNSSDLTSYRPYARLIYDAVKSLCPRAEVVLHQTWAYRSDSTHWGETGHGQSAANRHEMWQYSRAAYHTVAAELSVRLIPVGDAFEVAATNPRWGYRPDPKFNYDQPQFPELPDQTHSLHTGYHWSEERQLSADYKHATEAGCYLGSLVWYGFLFGTSPETISFNPPEVPADFAAWLRSVAAQILQPNAAVPTRLPSCR